MDSATLAGHYELIDEIGRGGMGVVYAARDSKLDRKVAIKMLESDSDPKLRLRLVREAQAMAKLAHPNVVSVHEIGEHEGAAFIVMEYVQGQTLREWLATAPRSVAEILAVFMAAGRGLAAMHEAGIVHRDFKPDNLMIRGSGQVLVMDLGIARVGSNALEPATAFDDFDDTAVELTRDGELMGSPAYMAAEQFIGEEVTPKTDQFSFCVSLWQALYGERPFPGEDVTALIEAVTEGRMRASRRNDVPAALHGVLERGLQSNAQARFESMNALLAEIERASGSGRRTWGRIAFGSALVVGLAVVGLAGLDRDEPPATTATEATEPSQPTSKPEPTGPRRITTTGTATKPALSPDGNRMVYLDEGRFVHLDLRSGETTTLEPLVSGVLGSQLSNDGTFMFSAHLNGKTGVYRMPSIAAAPVSVNDHQVFCRFPDRDRIVSFKLFEKAVTVSDANGTVLAEVPVEGEYEWLRDVACDPRNNRVAVHRTLGSTETLALIDLDGGPARVLFESAVELSSPHFDATGETLYYLVTRDGLTNLEATRVAGDDDLPVTRVVVPNFDATAISRSDSGRIAHARTQTIHHGIRRLGPADASLERAEQIVETDADALHCSPSPDETRLAYVESRRNLGRLMIRSSSDGSAHEVTRGDRLGSVAWSPDGETIAFIGQYRGQTHVWTVPASGGTPTVFERALASEGAPMAWAPSERILYERPDLRNFGMLDPSSEDDRPLIADDSKGFAFHATASPDGKSAAVLWTRKPAGVWAIDIEHGTSRLLIEGEYFPLRWSADGRFVHAAAREQSTLELHRIPTTPTAEASGPLEPWRVIDFGPRRTGECQVLSNEAVLCTIVERAQDIWITEAIE